MRLELVDFINAFGEVRSVRDTIRAYCLNGDCSRLSIEDLFEAVRQRYGVTLRTMVVRPRNGTVHGMLVWLSETDAVIVVSSRLSEYQLRYVVAKEVAHVMTGRAENWTVNPVDIIEFYAQPEEVLNGDIKPSSKVTAAEEVAKFVAVELMFDRDLHEPARQRLANGDDTIASLSEWLEMPDFLVEFAFGERHSSLVARVWSHLDVA